MIVCSSNAWGGCLPEYVPYIVKQAQSVDVICMQEVHVAYTECVPDRIMPSDPGSRTVPLNLHLFNQLSAALQDDFWCWFSPQMTGYLHDMESVKLNIAYGNAMFVRRTVGMLDYQQSFVYKKGPPHNNGETGAHKTAQAVVVATAGRRILISQTHGLWWKSNKSNVFPRSLQFKNWYAWLIELYEKYSCTDIVLCGDFNQSSKTYLISEIPQWSVFGPVPGRNLNQFHGITDTRTSHYTKVLREADYVFASPGLEPSLQIDYDVPSDHALLKCTLRAVG